MIKIKNVNTVNQGIADVYIKSPDALEINAKGLTLLPALIDPHVHFRIPGAEYKEDWISASKAAFSGGVTTVFDMPNNTPLCTSQKHLFEKHEIISQQLKKSGIPLRYYLYFGADKQQFPEIAKIKKDAIGIKVFMGSSTGDLLIDDVSSLRTVFRMAKDYDLLVSVHAEDEATILFNKQRLFLKNATPALHSVIRSPEAALKATSLALSLAKETGARLAILHVSTKEELKLIKQTKASGQTVYAEAAPHHLFLDRTAYDTWGAKVLVNPPLRDLEDQEALWEALNDGTIDFIGTDHAPHTLSEKALEYGKAPSGIPSIELLLPLMLDAVNSKRLTLATLVNLTRKNIERIFRLPYNSDLVLVDLNATRQVFDDNLKTKCKWSPYRGRVLKGWPVCTIARGKAFFNDGFK